MHLVMDAAGLARPIVASIFGVTGIPPMEKQAVRSKATRIASIRRVSRFIPHPPKRPRIAPDE